MKQENLKDLRKEYESASMTERQFDDMKQKIERAKIEKRRKEKMMLAIKSTAAAAAAFVILPNTSAHVAYAMEQMPVIGKLVETVTFREYHYEDERHSAEVEVQVPVVNKVQQGEAAGEQAGTGSGQEAETAKTLEKTTEEIRIEIEEITEQIIAEFKEGLKEEEGYQSIVVDSEVLGSTDSYFTLKLICYQGAGSGAQWNYYYTIDLKSGERITLKDLFEEGADYITPISENIREQMKEQMEADENVRYWLDEEEIPEWNFKEITEETSFYVNAEDDVVIAFNEGDVAPMYMGCVEFVIPKEVLSGIRK